MKTLIISAACAAVAVTSVSASSRGSLGFTFARKFVRSLAESLLHAETIPTWEAGTPPATTTEPTAWRTVPLRADNCGR